MSIEIDHLTKTFGPKKAVNELSLSIRPAELYAFLGPNGAGKTTTIKVVVGLLRPTSGSVRVCGHDVAADGLEARRLMSYVPDQPFLYDKLSGREFLTFVARMYQMDPEASRSRIAQISEQFGTTDYLDDLCEGYSHGMRQRLVMAAALLHDPKVLVVDEPMIGLDPRSARLVKDVFRDLVRSGVCVFMSTHTLSVAEEVADRVGIIHRGSLIAEGTVDELRSLGHTGRRLEDIFLALTEEEDSPRINTDEHG